MTALVLEKERDIYFVTREIQLTIRATYGNRSCSGHGDSHHRHDCGFRRQTDFWKSVERGLVTLVVVAS